jgi:formate-dependent nitrite reductase cytochrome c552 subunit
MNIFDALKATHQSYVSDLSTMISDDQVSLHSLEAAKADDLRRADEEFEVLIEWHREAHARRAALIAASYDRQISEVKGRLSRLATVRDRVDEGKVVQAPLEELTAEEAAILPKISVRGGGDEPRDLDEAPPAVARAA